MKKILMATLLALLLVTPMVFAKDDVDKIDKKLDKIMEKIGYVNYKVNVQGTEYTPSEPAKIWLQLLDNNQPVDNATCFISVFYPNNTLFINNQIMSSINNNYGLYYYDFITPSEVGVYMSTGRCIIPRVAFFDELDDVTYIKQPMYQTEISNSNLVLSSIYTEGWANSTNIYLDGDRWGTIYVDFTTYNETYEDNYIKTQIYSSNNTLLCENVTVGYSRRIGFNISECAGTTPEIYVRFYLYRKKNSYTSPEIHRYWVTWNIQDYIDLRGTGEIHVTSIVKNITSVCNPREIWKEFYLNPISQDIDLNLIYILLFISIILLGVVIWKR